MSTPSAVFLDTSVLAGQQYNFSSTAFSTFIPVAKKIGLKFLLPDPTVREVHRQISERSKEALIALETARRRAPFLNKWRGFPTLSQSNIQDWEVMVAARLEWNAFLSNFDVVDLGYSGIDLSEVMDWYDQVEAPFKEGKKRKEFPDAFAVAILNSYANEKGCYIAVISEDQDFKMACERFPKLLHFQTLPRLTELLLSEGDIVGKYHSSIEPKLSELATKIDSLLEMVNFYHENIQIEILAFMFSEITVSDFHVVAVGDNECTITFEASFESEFELEWEGFNETGEYWDKVTGSVTETFQITGSSKVRFSPITNGVVEITYTMLDEYEYPVSEIPKNFW